MVHASCFAHIAQQVEHFLGKEEVIGSNPIVSTICCAEGEGVKAKEEVEFVKTTNSD